MRPSRSSSAGVLCGTPEISGVLTFTFLAARPVVFPIIRPYCGDSLLKASTQPSALRRAPGGEGEERKLFRLRLHVGVAVDGVGDLNQRVGDGVEAREFEIVGEIAERQERTVDAALKAGGRLHEDAGRHCTGIFIETEFMSAIATWSIFLT
jgi:hypothetical protein